MASSVVPSLHGCQKFMLFSSPSAAQPPHHCILFTPALSVAQLRVTRYRDGFSACAVKNRRRDRGSGVTGTGGFAEEEDDEENQDEEEDEDEDEDEMFVPFGKMKNWLENKPRGFGVGKVYDTSIEDKLLEEITQSQQAQAANINKLKNTPVKPIPKKDASRLKFSVETPSGIRVRIANLPKKKNIHKDLRAAFSGTPGMLNIVPAVSGNSKTKDPVCKGFAFVDFKSENDAVRFIQTFSRQNITFGKVQKHIKCEILNPRSPIVADEESENETSGAAASQQTGFDLEEEPEVSSEVDDPFSESWEDLNSEEENELDGDDLVEAELEETYADMENLTLSDDKELDLVSSGASFLRERENNRVVSSKKQEKSRAKRQKPSGKGNGLKVKVPKLHIPGSAKRLKIKEKAVLTGVFSKYGAKADRNSNGES